MNIQYRVEHDYKLVDCIDDSGELEAQQRIFDDHDRRMMDFFTQITNLRSHEKIVTPPSKPAEETISCKPYNYHLQLITSWARIIDEAVERTKVETVDSGVLELMLEKVSELQDDLKIMLRELISLKLEATPLPEATHLDKVLRKLKLTVKHLIGEHRKFTDLIATIKDDTKSDTCNTNPTKSKGTSIKLSKLSIPKFDGDVLNWRTFREQFQVSIRYRDQLSNVEKLVYLKDVLKDGPAENVIQGQHRWQAHTACTTRQSSVC